MDPLFMVPEALRQILIILRSRLEGLGEPTGAATMVMGELFASDCLLASMPVSSPSARVELAMVR
jgi:hypothetical protein